MPSKIAIEQTIPRRSTQNSASLSFAQQSLSFLDQLEPESPSYNHPQVALLSSQLDVQALQKALDHLVASQEMLRTPFVPVDGVRCR